MPNITRVLYLFYDGKVQSFGISRRNVLALKGYLSMDYYEVHKDEETDAWDFQEYWEKMKEPLDICETQFISACYIFEPQMRETVYAFSKYIEEHNHPKGKNKGTIQIPSIQDSHLLWSEEELSSILENNAKLLVFPWKEIKGNQVLGETGHLLIRTSNSSKYSGVEEPHLDMEDPVVSSPVRDITIDDMEEFLIDIGAHEAVPPVESTVKGTVKKPAKHSKRKQGTNYKKKGHKTENKKVSKTENKTVPKTENKKAPKTPTPKKKDHETENKRNLKVPKKNEDQQVHTKEVKRRNIISAQEYKEYIHKKTEKHVEGLNKPR